MREQDLRGEQTVFAKARFVNLHQSHLADGCSRLQFMHCARAFAPAQPLHTFGDGAAGHQHDFAVEFSQLRDLRGPARERGVIQPLSLIGDQTGSNLDHEALGGFQGRRHGDLNDGGRGGRVVLGGVCVGCCVGQTIQIVHDGLHQLATAHAGNRGNNKYLPFPA